MPPSGESAAKRRRLAALEQAMGGGGRGSGRAGPSLHADAGRPPPPQPSRRRGPPSRPAAPPPQAASPSTSFTVDDPLYDPLPPYIVDGPLAALVRAAAMKGPKKDGPPGDSSQPSLASGDLAAILASLAATTPRGPDAAARAAALTRLAERHLLMDNPTAGLRRGAGSAAAAALAAGGAATGVPPSGGGSTLRLALSHAARRAVAGRLSGGTGSKTIPPAALEALAARWRAYASATLAADTPPSATALPPWLDLHGAPVQVLACRDGRQVCCGSSTTTTIITRDRPAAWGVADLATGRVRFLAKAGTELGVRVGKDRELVRVLGDLRVGR